ncbi:MAG: outer membrane protein A [Syntrophorhabdus sp. PtaB.Bin184]|nr:MAG: outer membrane protein A [Syntrophorhabdus sp. PtaB.Bin184]
MKGSCLFLISTLFILIHTVESGATGIYQTDYSYPFEGMARSGLQAKTFMICEHTPAAGPYLLRATRSPMPAVRVSQDVAPGPQGTKKEPEGPRRENATNWGGKERQSAPEQSLTILFAFDSAVLDDVARATLSSFVESMGARTKDSYFSVTGYTCDLGRKDHNDILARQRAEAVAGYLRKAGMHLSEVTGTGKCCYATNDPDKRYMNRRVEVRAQKKEITQ